MYVLDTSSFKVLGNYYPETFPTIWKDFDGLVKSGRLVSVKEVRKELERGNHKQHLSDWIDRNGNIFGTPSADEMAAVAEILAIPHFQQMIGEKQRLRGDPVADPWIIAKAELIGGCVVTEEAPKPNSAKIPNVCNYFGVACANVETMLDEEGWKY